ncbi:MAG TPA: hypothetical protein VFM05_02400 [Candidatus Saccharimonadales bacterium]|nr:hypothetical protein [Candidatus Saccharimonadales bacterium]
MKVFTVSVPNYQVDTKPDYRAIGAVVDVELKKHFLSQMVGLRALGSQEHPGKTADELVEIIKHGGTDRYDPTRGGDRYDNVEDKHIDLFLLRRKITEKSKIFWQFVWSFYESPLKVRGYSVRVDILVVYDLSKLRAVRTTHTHEGRPITKRDGYIFRDPANKADAVLGIIKVLD